MNLQEAGRLARAVLRVLRDSERTEEIHVAEELTGRRRLGEIRATLFEAEEARALLDERPELCGKQVSFDALRGLPEESLGFQYVHHLDRGGLAADSQAAATRFVPDPEIAYLVRRFRQTHDVWHALVGLGTKGHEEVILHAFSWGQLRLPVSAMVVLFGTAKHIVLERRCGALHHALWEAYVHGRDALPLLPVYWERHWEEPMEAVRRRLGVRPCTRTFVEG
jgi:ubiquinone biosynthesis protein COQ4